MNDLKTKLYIVTFPKGDKGISETKAYEKKYNESISSFGGHAWDSLQIAVKALKAVGPDRAKIRDFIENLTGYVGQHGVFNFSAADHNGLSKDDLEMVVVKNGDWAIAK